MTGATTSDGATRAGGPQARGRPPAFLSRFIGRRSEMAELAHLVGERRLVTISGTGGGGKTRLASEVLGAIAVRWADGVV